MFAAAAGRETNVKFLLERGANGDARTEVSGASPSSTERSCLTKLLLLL